MFIAWSTFLLFLHEPAQKAQAQVTMTEYQVKALFLFNFAKYVDWPAATLPTPDAPLIIGVLGQDNLNEDLSRVVDGKSINGHPILIKHITTEAEMAGCQILFIGASENSRLEEILGKIAALHILTVGEDEQFWQRGGIINFTLREQRVRLEVNLSAALRAQLQISSKLLSVADVVKGKPT
jgi:hypothetical protein